MTAYGNLRKTFIAALLAVALAMAGVAAISAGGSGLIQDASAAKKKVSGLKAYPKSGPSGLNFYYPARKYPKKKFPKISLPSAHGQLVWTGAANDPVRLSSSSVTRKILYTSRTVKNKNVVVSGAISIPEGTPPAGGWPVITYGHGTTGIADQCAPSREDINEGERGPYTAYTDGIQNSWLDAGYAVIRTDYEGLGTDGVHPFLVGRAAGRSVLDIVRASRQTGYKLSKDYFIAGHSQGGNAALWAAGQAESWLPEMNLKGTIAYAPASGLDRYANALPGLTNPSSLSGLAAMIVRGLSSVDTALNPSQLLTPPALALFPETLTKCLGELGAPDSFGGLAPSTLLQEAAADALSLYEGPFSAALAAQQPAVTSEAPILIPQGSADTTTPPPFTTTLVQQLKALNGADKVTLETYVGADHSGVVTAANDDVLAWMASH